MRIAMLDSDRERAAFVRDTLFCVGHICHLYYDAAALVHDLRRESFDLLVLGWNLHELTDEMMLRWVRGHYCAPDMPVLVIGGKQVISDVGPDAYATWPIPAELLVAQVGAIFRYAYGINSGSIREVHGSFSFNLEMDRVWLNERLLELTRGEFKIALHLCRHLGRAVSRAHLMEVATIHSSNTGSRTLDVYVSKVRAKLAQCPGDAYRLRAIYGYGYRLDRAARLVMSAPVVVEGVPAHR